ncbi:glycerol dehydratase reactivase beta/small subunit family protein [Halalkalicoccus salilacus]|uniref:glycerol dehydratase reactivase beta/small subunit family protein n=1 Tax=Halalkalicoccus salilacus TaxID=3117459 RepID=UPI00300EE0AF
MSDHDDSASTDGDVPRIIVRYLDSDDSAIEQLERGIEEEGVPWTVQRVEADESGSDHQRTDPTAVAHRAASDSGLKIGIGVSEDGELTLHHARLPEDDPLFTVANATAREARTVGTNAARLAKHMPLKPLD